MNEILMEKMTWPDIQSCLNDGYKTAVIACGAIEQHGPHLPLFVDSEHGTVIAERVAKRLGDALIAPTIRVGYSDEHLDFPGTLSFRKSTFEAVCTDYCRSLARHGFKKICFIPSHGGNFEPLKEIKDNLQKLVTEDVGVKVFTDMSLVIKLWKQVAEEEASLAANVGGHADIAESSIMLALYPELVRWKSVEAGYTEILSTAQQKKVKEDGIQAITSNGILGDPQGMSAEIGRRCIDAYVDTLGILNRKTFTVHCIINNLLYKNE
jgi:creatinine amidohydrolase